MTGTIVVASTRPSEIRLSPDGSRIYAAGSDGVLRVYEASTGTLLNSWPVGQQLGGLDISPDGSFLVVVDRGISAVYKVDSTTGEKTTFFYGPNGYEGLYFDVAVLANGTAIFSQDYQGSGWTTLKTLNLQTGAITEGQMVRQSSTLTRSPSGDSVLIGEPNISSAQIDIFRPGAPLVTAMGSGFNSGIQAYSGALVAQYLPGSGINIFNGNLQRVVTLASWSGGGVTDVAFSADGKILFVLDGVNDRIVSISTTDWVATRTYVVGADVGSGMSSIYGLGGRLIVDPLERGFSVVTDTGLVQVANPDFLGGTNGADLLNGNAFSNVIDGLAGDDQLFGGDGSDKLYGRSGDDRLQGDAGDDQLFGGSGVDIMLGGAGNDTYEVDNVADVVFEVAGEGVDRVAATVDYTLPGQVENLSMGGGAQVYGHGNGLANTIIGNAAGNSLAGFGGNDRLEGGAGDDAMDGGEGNDVLLGGTGADLLLGGAGNDIYEVDNIGDAVWEAADNGTADNVFAYVDYALPWNVENLIMLYGNQRFGYGNSGDNIIIGNSAANAIEGGAGYDTLTGGGGSDLYVVRPGWGVDVITDFVAGLGTPDAVLFDSRLFTSFAQVMGNSAQVGNDTWIGDGLGNTVVLVGVQKTSLHPNDFGFI